MLTIQIAEPLHKVFDGPARYRVAYGGRGSTKSHGFGTMSLVRAMQKRCRILCARELQVSIKESVHHLLASKIDKLKLPGFQVGESFIRHINGSEFIFKGLRSNINEIKSLEDIDICWVEEAQAVSKESWDVLIPTIRSEGSEVWVTFNPGFKTDPTSDRFIEKPPPNSRIVKINFDENPWFTQELREEMEYLKAVDPIAYRNVWLGEYRDPSAGGKVVKSWAFANVEEIPYQEDQRVYLTCDFNVDPMCWALAHIFTINGERHYHFFDEIVIENTNIIKTVEHFVGMRDGLYSQHTAGLVITGDSSGNTRTDGTPDPNQTRYNLLLKTLSDFGVQNYALDARRANPLIDSRIQVFNTLVCNQKGERRIKVDPRCKQIIRNCENLHYIPGSEQVWQPTPKQIDKDNRMKFERQDMFDAVSYLVNKYDGRVERVDKPKPKVATMQFKPR